MSQISSNISSRKGYLGESSLQYESLVLEAFGHQLGGRMGLWKSDSCFYNLVLKDLFFFVGTLACCQMGLWNHALVL